MESVNGLLELGEVHFAVEVSDVVLLGGWDHLNCVDIVLELERERERERERVYIRLGCRRHLGKRERRSVRRDRLRQQTSPGTPCARTSQRRRGCPALPVDAARRHCCHRLSLVDAGGSPQQYHVPPPVSFTMSTERAA